MEFFDVAVALLIIGAVLFTFVKLLNTILLLKKIKSTRRGYAQSLRKLSDRGLVEIIDEESPYGWQLTKKGHDDIDKVCAELNKHQSPFFGDLGG